MARPPLNAAVTSTRCHSFSPSKIWINGFKQLRKPFAYLHTPYNRDIPWATIDMDFMNMNQARTVTASTPSSGAGCG